MKARDRMFPPRRRDWVRTGMIVVLWLVASLAIASRFNRKWMEGRFWEALTVCLLVGAFFVFHAVWGKSDD
jgi:uncharacterized membrane protein